MSGGAAKGPIKVAIVGGGCAAIAAAHELTRPELEGRFEVTIYQQGWRLGGKGASGRGPNGRIEEHGLHVWMGCYENAFRLMRTAYAELARDPKTCPIAGWRDAFFPTSHIGLANWEPQSSWTIWATTFPPLPGEPGEPLRENTENPFTVAGYLARMADVLRTLFETAYGPSFPSTEGGMGRPMREIVAAAERLASTALGAIDSVAGLASNQLATLTVLLKAAISRDVGPAIDRLSTALLRAVSALRPRTARDPNRERAGEVLEITLAAVVGIIRGRLLVDPRGFESIDDVDFVDWLRQNGLSEHAASSPFLRGLYSLMFAYEDGDYTRPRQAAGQALRGCIRMFFTYRGSFFWKMQAGMGDIVFAPLYEVLKQRGVRFEFFHRLSNVRLAASTEGKRHVGGLDFTVQADVRGGGEYAPLVEVQGLPSWPSKPDWAQLDGGEDLEKRGTRFESHWDTASVRTKTLEVGEDFDLVVLGVSVGAIPYVCREILAVDARWRSMVENLATVATCALQLWTTVPLSELGWRRGSVTMTGFASPFDTWSDMTHLAPAEGWPTTASVRSVAYFCNVLDERDVARSMAAEDHQSQVRAVVRSYAATFFARDLPKLWPGLSQDGEVRWSVLADGLPGGSEPSGPARIDTQYFVGNINPTDRYVQCLPGTPRFRISPLDRTYDNLAITGDWTDCGLNLGCVESAVISGLLAAHAISGFPELESIVGYDHP